MKETTFMKIVIGPTGIIEKKMNPRTMQIWTKSNTNSLRYYKI